jgi:hypothetical protein
MIQVDIYRPENNGLMNVIGCVIAVSSDATGSFCHQVIRGEANKGISGGTSTVLLGGDRVICEINPSSSIKAFTPRGMRPDASAESPSWGATTLTPRARAGETVEVGIVPKARGSTYVGGWVVRQEPHATTDKRAAK